MRTLEGFFNGLGYFISRSTIIMKKKKNQSIHHRDLHYVFMTASVLLAFKASACVLANEETCGFLFCFVLLPFFVVSSSQKNSPSSRLRASAAGAAPRVLRACVKRTKERERVSQSKSGERDHSTFQLAVWRLPSNRCGCFLAPWLVFFGFTAIACFFPRFLPLFEFSSALPIRMI